MKQIIYSILLIAGVSCAFAACSNGAYDANPGSSANGSVNPLDPLDSAQFNWISSATGAMSANINGAGWSAGDSSAGWVLDTTGTNIIAGYSGNSNLILYLKSVYAVNIYGMGYKNMITYAVWVQNDTSVTTSRAYYSYKGNSGEVQILENDVTRIKGLFYFQGIDSAGDVINVSNGYFNVSKL